MKKRISLLLVLVMVLTMGLCACGEKSPLDQIEVPDLNVYDYDLSQYIDLGQYKGIEVVPVKDVEVTDEDIQAEIDSRVQSATTSEYITEGVVADGDLIKVDYKGFMNGEEFEGGTSNPALGGIDLLVGAGVYIPGFEEGLIGANIGDTVTLDLEFPDPYQGNPDFSGLPVTFEITIHGKTVYNTPEYDLDFIKANSECTSVEEYEAMVYDELLAQKKEDAQAEWESALWDTIFYNTTVHEFPQDEIDVCVNEYKQYYNQTAAQYGTTLEAALEAQGLTMEDFDETCQAYAESVITNEMILFAIADAEGLRLTEDEYKAGVQELIETSGFEDQEAFKKEYGSDYADYVGVQNVIVSLTMDKVFTFVKDNIVYASGEPVAEENAESTEE